MKKKTSIEDLERILNDDSGECVEILPNGKVKVVKKKKKPHILTKKEDLPSYY